MFNYKNIFHGVACCAISLFSILAIPSFGSDSLEQSSKINLEIQPLKPMLYNVPQFKVDGSWDSLTKFLNERHEKKLKETFVNQNPQWDVYIQPYFMDKDEGILGTMLGVCLTNTRCQRLFLFRVNPLTGIMTLYNLGDYVADSVNVVMEPGDMDFPKNNQYLYVGKKIDADTYTFNKFTHDLKQENPELVTILASDSNAFDVLPLGSKSDDFFVERFGPRSMECIFISSSGEKLMDPENYPYTQTNIVYLEEGTVYRIHAKKNIEDGLHHFIISAYVKKDGRFKLIPTNVDSQEYIVQFIVDSKDPLKILAFQKFESPTDRLGSWTFLDTDFENEVRVFRKNVNDNLSPMMKGRSWEFKSFRRDIPIIEDDIVKKVITGGNIEFKDLCLNEEGDDESVSVDGQGRVCYPQRYTLKDFPSPETHIVLDKHKDTVQYDVFRASNEAAPTVLYIYGGPHGFIDHKEIYKEIEFFTKAGYHFVVPLGLFRLGYSVEHYNKSQGEFGLADIDQLCCVLKDLLDKQISSGRPNVMGHSYGGYCAARLSYYEDLVNSAVISGAALDIAELLEKFPVNQFFVLKNDVSPADLKSHLAKISPACQAPLPRVRVLIHGVESDVRCPIEPIRQFVRRLRENKQPFVYLEGALGGHQSMFSHFGTLQNFFEGRLGVSSQSDLPGYKIIEDTMGFLSVLTNK